MCLGCTSGQRRALSTLFVALHTAEDKKHVLYVSNLRAIRGDYKLLAGSSFF